MLDLVELLVTAMAMVMGHDRDGTSQQSHKKGEVC